MKTFAIIFTSLLMSGCITTPGISNGQPVQKNHGIINSNSSSYNQNSTHGTVKKLVDESPCRFIPGYRNNEGIYIPHAYECSESSVYATGNINSCSWVAPYKEFDETSVAGYYRCHYNRHPSTYSPSGSNSAQGIALCVSSYCGPVQVKGYYRKNGTYVRPHTRSRRR